MGINKIRYIHLQFDQPLMAYDIPKFRAAVIEASKRQSDLFHNHASENGYIYRYPLIQYKIIEKRPAIICLNEGTDDIHYLLNNREFKFTIGKEEMVFEIDELRLKYHTLQPWQESFHYHLHNWLPLNQENYQKYNELSGVVEKYQLLDGILKAHLLILLEETGIKSDIKLKANITEIQDERYLPLKGQYLKSMKLNFKTNVSLPNYIGLGKGSSVGFGIVKRINPSNGKRKNQGQDRNRSAIA